MAELKTGPEIKVYPVLLAGGTGTRLWPVSRELYPKQLVNFIGQDSLVQSTIKRLSPVLITERVKVVCGKEHFYEIARHLEEIGVSSAGKIVCEPFGRNTAPAILLGLLNILKVEQDAILCVFPADHVIKNVELFHEKVESAIRLADKGHIVTFGIRPHYPETGYGYIEGNQAVLDGALSIKRFVEKPDIETAKKYVAAGNFFWNSGMFAFKASVMIEEFKRYEPELFLAMDKMISEDDSLMKQAYEKLQDVSIDYAIMEKTDKGVVLPSDFGWSDIGSWKSLYDFLPKDENNNVIDGDVITNETDSCFIMGHERLVAANHLSNMVLVETPDSVFVSDLDNSRNVKSIVAKLKEKGRKEYYQHKTVYHPWGKITIQEQEEDYCVSRLVIYPDSMFQFKTDSSLVTHLMLIKGLARITKDGRKKNFKVGKSITIFQGATVELENSGLEPLVIIQVSIGG